jgi:hypothetical protein
VLTSPAWNTATRYQLSKLSKKLPALWNFLWAQVEMERRLDDNPTLRPQATNESPFPLASCADLTGVSQGNTSRFSQGFLQTAILQMLASWR